MCYHIFIANVQGVGELYASVLFRYAEPNNLSGSLFLSVKKRVLFLF